MKDQCVIRRDQDHDAGATLNRETGELEGASPQPEVYRGPCMVFAPTLQARTTDASGIEGAVTTYPFGLPHTAPEIRPGDEVTVLRSEDKTLLNQTFVVRDVASTSFLVYRRVTTESLRSSRG